MKKINLLYAFFVCLFVFVFSLFIISLENSSKESKETASKSEKKNYIYNENISYSSIESLEDLKLYIDYSGISSTSTRLIIIGANGNYVVDGVDTGIYASNNETIENSYVLFIEQTSETDEEIVYTILNSKKQTIEFKINKENQKIDSDLDIKIGDNGNWFINDIDTFIKANESGYDNFIDNFDIEIDKAEWLEEIKNGTLNISSKEQYTCLVNPNNNDFPYYINTIEGTYLMEPIHPVKKGYTFTGWYYNDNKYEFGKELIKGNIILNAKYKEDEYYVVMNSNNGEKNKIIKIHYNDILTLPTPTKEGCLFEGWFNSKNEKIENGKYGIEGNSYIVAKWSSIYTLSIANSDIDLCNESNTIKDAISSDDWYCDDILVLNPRIDQVYADLITSIDGSNRASSERTVINDLLKLDIVGETKLEKTAMIQDLDYESEPRYYVRT